MNAVKLADLITEALYEAAPDVRLQSLQDAGVLTTNDGLVIRCTDGSEFQLTIVQSK